MRRAVAFAPATVANVAVGFDVLGFAVEGIGDTVTVTEEGGSGRSVRVEGVEGAPVPVDPERNTASVAVRAYLEARGLDGAYAVRVEKGIPLSAGMGGSAASAVGAVVAVNALQESPLPREGLLPYALRGETAASGAPHADNAAPCLFGGLTAVFGDPPEVLEVPVPPGLLCVLVHPDVLVDTRTARAGLAKDVPLAAHVRQSGRLAASLVACFRGDLTLLGRALRDELIEPQRAPLIPGFAGVRRAALEAGAIACSISGSGPTLFALAAGRGEAERARDAMRSAFRAHGTAAEGWISAAGGPGAAIIGSP